MDQIFHIVVIIIIVLITQPMNINNNAILSNAANIFKITEMNKYTWLITAYLLCGKSAAVFVKLLLITLNTEEKADHNLTQNKNRRKILWRKNILLTILLISSDN